MNTSNDNNAKLGRIGLALSGGGSRAIAFHLGCLRALNDLGLLSNVSVLSTVSGGSVIGAAYSLHTGTFPEFEVGIRKLLRSGLVIPMLRQFFSPVGGQILASSTLAATAAVGFKLGTRSAAILSRLLPHATTRSSLDWSLVRSPIRRSASRTTLLEASLDRMLFSGKRIDAFRSDKPKTIINATELRTGSAFRFSAIESGSYRWGRITQNNVKISHAVAASAAYPIALPAFDDIYEFEKDGVIRKSRVLLSDGGVYDNLGLGPLWPDRRPDVSLNVESIDTIICCSAGFGLRQDPTSQFFFARINSAMTTTFERSQNASISKLHELHKSHKIRKFLFPYLGQQDDRLPSMPDGLVSREESHTYPTNFSAMPAEWIERLSLRGYQLTMCLAKAYF